MIQRHEKVGDGGEETRGDHDYYERGYDRFAYARVHEDIIVRLAVCVRDKTVVFVYGGEGDRGNDRAYRGDHELEVLSEALDPYSHLVLLRVEAVGHDRILDYVLRTSGEIVQEQRYRKEHEALFECEQHYGGCNAVCEIEYKTRLARSESGNEQRGEKYARRESYRSYGLYHAQYAAVAELIGAYPRQKRGQHALETVEEFAYRDKPEFLVLKQYFHACREFDLIDVRFGQNDAFLSVIHRDEAHEEAYHGEYRHEYAIGPYIFHGVVAEKHKSESRQKELYHAGTEIAQKFRKAHDLRAFRRIGTDDLRYAHLSVVEQGLGYAQQIEENADENDFQGHVAVYRNEPRQSHDGDNTGNARPKDIRSEFSYRGVRVVHEHTYERGLYNADHVRNDKQPHEISRAESVNGSGEQTRRRHLNV